MKAGVKATLTPYQRVTSALCHMEGDVSVLLPRFPDNYGLNPGCYVRGTKILQNAPRPLLANVPTAETSG